MNLKKIVAAVAAAAMALTMSAVNVFAATVTLDSEYTGAWTASSAIPKADLEAIGGDVKITLNVTPKKLMVKDQIVLKPITVGDSWIAVEEGLTSDTECRKPDGFIVIKQSATTVSFVMSSAAVASLTDNGLCFQVYNVTINSAELSAGTPEGDFKLIEDKVSKDYSSEKATYEELMGIAPAEEAAAEETEEAAPAEEEAAEETEEEAAPAEEEAAEETEEEAAPAEEEAAEETEEEAAPAETEAAPAETAAPAADSTTTAATTGNTSAVTIIGVMALAAAAAVTVKKSK
ncbi:MAG: hypothetical protein ACI4KF_02095 [Huintestinicola sp.]